jgi:NAD(P)-dependent dehydrogenase (short-subunit alcohol dehydrogenase family)
MTGRLEGKVALITGGTSGIGEATVKAFVAEGARVVICGRNSSKGDEMAAALGAATRFVKADVSREADIKSAIDATLSAFGRLDCLFNNAGGPTRGGVDTVTSTDFTYAMELLLGSVVFGMRHAAPVMKTQGRAYRSAPAYQREAAGVGPMLTPRIGIEVPHPRHVAHRCRKRSPWRFLRRLRHSC